MTARLGVIVLLLAGLTGPARAAVSEDSFALHRAADLAALCSAAPEEPFGTPAQNFCHGFITGVFRVLYDIGLAKGHQLFCLPVPSPARATLATAFSAWVLADPARKDSPAEDALLRFLTTQYPCEGQKR